LSCLSNGADDLTYDSGDSSVPPSAPPDFTSIVDEFLKEGVPPIEQFLSSLHESFNLDPTISAILFGMIGKYLLNMKGMRAIGMSVEEAHSYSITQVMKDERVDRIIEEYTVGTTQFFISQQFGVEVDE